LTEVIKMVSEQEAQRLTSRIKLVIESIDTSYEKLLDLIGEAQNSNTWQLMGFPSWVAYLASLFDGRQVALPREDRKALTTLLSEQGMSVRAIAPIVGVSKATVQRDYAGVSHGTPQPAQQVAAVEPATATTASLDGKTYPRTPDKPRHRPPLPKQAQRAVWDAQKAVERLDRVMKDDRFASNLGSITELVGRVPDAIGDTVALFRRSLSVGRVAAIEERQHGDMGVMIATSVVGDLVDIEEVTPDQAAAALEHLQTVMQKLSERAGA
jgi:transposase-like protein